MMDQREERQRAGRRHESADGTIWGTGICGEATLKAVASWAHWKSRQEVKIWKHPIS